MFVLWVLQDEAINCSGEDVTQDLEVLEFW